nr:unnamed protein product [Callosobruchus analis]
MHRDGSRLNRANVPRTENRTGPSRNIEKENWRSSSNMERRENRYLPAQDCDGRPLCFICKRYGHVSRHCRTRDTPRDGRQQMQSEPRENHTTRQGMERPNDVSRRNVHQVNVPVPSTSTTQMIIKQNPIDTTSQGCRGTIMKYIKDIKVNDHIMTRAFIDPGSAVCTVRQKFIDEHNINCYRANETLYGFGTDNKVNSNEFAKVTVTMDNIKEDVLMYVVPDDVQFTDILLGRSLTDKTNLAYVRIDDNLHFGYRDELPFCDIQLRDETRRIKLYADEDVILKGDMINLIMVTGEYNDLWPVMNSTTEDFEVTKGQCVFNVTERKIEIQEENLCVGQM